MKFEDALKRLEAVVEKLERGELSLDNSLKAFEEGVRLSRFLNGKLEEAEGRVEILLRDAEGQPAVKPFEPDENRGGETGLEETDEA